MGDIAIRVEQIGKKYKLGQKTSTSLSEQFRDLFSSRGQSKSEEFWALRDVSFEIKKGEAVGIIGKNGAGKSTLLKILSRITHPTIGRFEMHGRVSSLLEVGTGFHPELSGRENIFLNGTILGMTRSEIKSKFDEIVAFSGVDKFIDTPVKHYSSGMYVRLAFSVAAHLEPEILIIDEVLAVGDAEFQKKCLGKMDEVTKQGRTVLFVSHNMGAIENLCNQGMLIESGTMKMCGDVHIAIDHYLRKEFEYNVFGDLTGIKNRTGKGLGRFANYSFYNKERKTIHVGSSGDFLGIRLTIQLKQRLTGCRVSMAIGHNSKPLFLMSTENTISENIEMGTLSNVCFELERLPLDIGSYGCTLYFESTLGVQDAIQEAFELKVEKGSFFISGKNSPKGWEGLVTLIEHKCSVNEN